MVLESVITSINAYPFDFGVSHFMTEIKNLKY